MPQRKFFVRTRGRRGLLLAQIVERVERFRLRYFGGLVFAQGLRQRGERGLPDGIVVIARGELNQREPAFGQRRLVGKHLLHGADFVRGDFRLRFLAPHDARHRFVDKRYQHAGAARQRRDVGISEQAEGNVYGDF